MRRDGPFQLCLRARQLRRLSAVLCLCFGLAGFAAQVPSPPPEELPATPLRAEPLSPEPAAGASSAWSTGQPGAGQALPAADEPAPGELPDAGPYSADRVLDLSSLTGPEALDPYVEWYADPSGTLSIHDIAFADVPFAPLGRPWPHRESSLWLRLRIAPMPEGLDEQLYVRLGPGLPGYPAVWMTRPGSTEPVVIRHDEVDRYPVLYSQNGGTMFIRSESWPTVSFAPWIGNDRTTGAVEDPFRLACLGLLALAAVACLLRGLAERREWRFWAALFIGAAFVSSFWQVPAMPGGRLLGSELPALLAPALALFLLPLAGRHLMQPRNTMPWLDNCFLFVSLAGLCAGLLPLAPGLSWLLRFHPLWPLGSVLTAFLCLIAGRKGLAGWGRFCLASLAAAVGPVVLLAPHPDAPPEFGPVLALAPLYGLTLAALLLAVVGGRPLPRSTVERRGSRRKAVMPQVTPLSLEPETADAAPPVPESQSYAVSPSASGDPVLHLPFSRTGPRKTARPRNNAALSRKEPPAAAAARSAVPADPVTGQLAASRDPLDPEALTTLEETLRVPLDALLREAIALDMQDLSSEARTHASALVAAGRKLSGIITSISRTGLPHPTRLTIENAYIDLPQLLRGAHAAVAEAAEERNLAVSWYMAPHLSRRYTGPSDRLCHILRLLMESAVQATDRGSVQLWARRVQDSNDPGHLVFTVADTGSGMPPERRNPLLPATLWELVGETGGSLHIDSNPAGTTIAFSVRLTALPVQETLGVDTGMTAEALDGEPLLALPSLRLILADDLPSRRQLLAYMLEGLPHELIEARTPGEAATLHGDIPARLIVFDGSMDEKQVIDAVAAIRTHDGDKDLPPAVFLALVGHESQGERLRRAGVDHILYKPVNRSIIRQAVLHLAPVPGLELPPLPATRLPDSRPVSNTPETVDPASGSPAVPDASSGSVTNSSTGSQPDLAAGTAGQGQQKRPGEPASEPMLALNLTVPESPEADAPLPVSAAASLAASTGLELADDDEGLLPPPGARKQARRFSILDQLLVSLPGKARRRPRTVPDPAAAAPRPRVPASRSVGEPMPLARPAGEPASDRKPARQPRRQPPPQAPRLAPTQDDSHLSENGVGIPMPIIRPGSSDAHLSENGVGEPMPILKVDATLQPADDTDQREMPREPGTVAGAPPVQHADPVSASLLDLIESVEAVEPQPGPEAGAGEDDPPSNVAKTGPQADQSTSLPPGTRPEQAGSEDPAAGEEAGDAVFLSLLQSLDDKLAQVQDGLKQGDTALIMAATGSMAEQAEQFGLHVLAKLARVMQEMAAAPEGLEAVEETMPDLRSAVERNRQAFSRPAG